MPRGRNAEARCGLEIRERTLEHPAVDNHAALGDHTFVVDRSGTRSPRREGIVHQRDLIRDDPVAQPAGERAMLGPDPVRQ